MDSQDISSIHFIGIGGVGMSGIARVAHDQGLLVTGSDLRESRYTEQLRDVGIAVAIGHDKTNIPHDPVPDAVVVSTAILDNNPELIAARERNIPIWHRAQMLARLGEGLDTFAVAGTHGKTTASSMLASVLDGMGLSPTFLIGGIVRAYASNAHSGTGSMYVVEADESDKSFMHLSPKAVLVTNVEADHLDHYRDLTEIHEKFAAFMSSVPAEGVLVVCGEDASLLELAQSLNRPFVTYGFDDFCDVHITEYTPHGIRSDFTLVLPDGTQVASCVPQNPGRHNVLNAAGVIGLVYALGYDAVAAARAMESFAGVRRRFDLVGEHDGITIVDDYAHHPTEIAATIKAAAALDFKRVHVLFQPHRYSRAPLFTEVLHDDFAHAFDAADTVTFMDVYSAGETPIPGINGQTFLSVVQKDGACSETFYIPRRPQVVPHLLTLAKEGDLVLTMGAGDVTAIGPEMLHELKR